MEVCRGSSWRLVILGVILLASALQGVQGEVEIEGPSESECRPYIEKALRQFENVEAGDADADDSNQQASSIDIVSVEEAQSSEQRNSNQSGETIEIQENVADEAEQTEETHQEDDGTDKDTPAGEETKSGEDIEDSKEKSEEVLQSHVESEETKEQPEEEIVSITNEEQSPDQNEISSSEDQQKQESTEDQTPQEEPSVEDTSDTLSGETSKEDELKVEEQADKPSSETSKEEAEIKPESSQQESQEETPSENDQTESASRENEAAGATSEEDTKSEQQQEQSDESNENQPVEEVHEEASIEKPSAEITDELSVEKTTPESSETQDTKEDSSHEETQAVSNETIEEQADEPQIVKDTVIPTEEPTSEESDKKETEVSEESKEASQPEGSDESQESPDAKEDVPVEDLIIDFDIPTNLRDRDHVESLLKIDRDATKTEEIIDRISEITLRELKRLYENAIKPLEILYKYRDLSNRHYGDAEIFSKPLILFMGPWSGGKSSIINYLLNIEYNDTALRTGAEPSPAYFNLLMYGEQEEILDGTQLAADYTFSGLQKFGQGLEERLRGVKLNNKFLEKVNIVEIPGILEVRKQVSRVFPFNDACQWFIDRADIIFLVYDPSKLDVGPETEAILDQLKGREYQTRIVLNKADQVKPEELMRVQSALIWNISPLMSSPQPPIMYTTSLWSRPFEQWAPVRLLQSQERAFLRDLRSAIDKRIENKIAGARRFAVRVRNHAKMVDCYLTTYYNHKSIFGNRKLVSDAIIEHPQDYHIYEGLSTLTNISRYDLPDPDVYKDFFRLNPLYEFQQLSATCTYFRGCPINKLDVAIAYDLPELVGKHKRLVESALAESSQEEPQGS